ncbi:hypothetical protein DPX16_13528 [Anabarilius grahami]|uniref:Uncharacterized protein n=1 Tax=Anabarilius grahami TaxID=495550 RepID=A0A3N0YBL1_ANAGA|nr:hypothetical protein DPX16_13528 [Anabarilius grahami]
MGKSKRRSRGKQSLNVTSNCVSDTIKSERSDLNSTNLKTMDVTSEGEAIEVYDSTPIFVEGALGTPFPETPVKPMAKKNKRQEERWPERSDGNASILSAIRELSAKHDETFKKIATIEMTTDSTSKMLESLSSTVHQLVLDVGQHSETLKCLDGEIKTLKEENKSLRAGLYECRRYSWRWLLKLHGVKERAGEDVRRVVIDIFGKMAPDVRDSLNDGVDIAHRLGPARDDGKARAIIVLFSFRRVRDGIWRAERRCKYLEDNSLRLTEPLSPEDRAAREKLWPLVKAARDAGKKASFRSSFALIDGKKHFFSDVK